MRTGALAATLLLRAVIHGGFAAWLIVARPAWTDIFRIGAYCGFADGTLGLLTVSLIVPFAPVGAPRLLATVTFVDAIGRLATSAAIVAFPGLTFTFITIGTMFGLVGAVTASLGLAVLAAWLIARVRAGRTWSLDYDALFDPLAVAAAASMTLGYVLFIDPPATAEALRTLGIEVCAVLTTVFLIASVGALVHRPAA